MGKKVTARKRLQQKPNLNQTTVKDGQRKRKKGQEREKHFL
jgi:hypothetical protein